MTNPDKTNVKIGPLQIINSNRAGFVQIVQNMANQMTGVVPPSNSSITIDLWCDCRFFCADMSLIDERSQFCFHGNAFIDWRNGVQMNSFNL